MNGFELDTATPALDGMRERLRVMFGDARIRDLIAGGVRRDLFDALFRSLGGSGHVPWAPLSDATIRRRGSTPWPYLGDYSTENMTGHLKRSLVEGDNADAVTEVLDDGDTLGVGSAVSYGVFQAPLRPLVPAEVDEFTAAQLADLVAQWVAFGELGAESF